MLIPADLLSGKKILLGVTGSIAAYKSLELLRLFTKAGAEVKVVMTPAAKKFVAPLSFEALSRNRVLDDTNESWSDDFNHIKTSQWADIMVIAPASANTLAKLSNGIADTILTQCALAFPSTKLLAPSANTHMIHNPMIQASMKNLEMANYQIVGTQVKELACQTTGDGAMAEPLEVFWHTSRILLSDPFWKGRDIILSGGGTLERLDDVRYISNFSSGKMASALATALYLKGADIHLIATRFESNLPQAITVQKTESSSEMYHKLSSAIHEAKNQDKSATQTPYLFMAAAISDYIPLDPKKGKLKKESLGDTWNISMKQNIDILSSLDKNGIKTIAFKAETDPAVAHTNAKNMIERKGVDAVCLNVIDESNGFGDETNRIDFITSRDMQSLPKADKLSLSLQLLEKVRNI